VKYQILLNFGFGFDRLLAQISLQILIFQKFTFSLLGVAHCSLSRLFHDDF